MNLKELFDSPDKWCRRNLAQDKDGSWVSPHDSDAVKWCLLGGCMKCLGFNVLKDVVYERTGQNVWIFNDDPNTTFEDIVEVLEEWEKRNESA